MNELIKEKLAELESTRNIKILYACESGSRAWGFPSPDSDYDVRFIYSKPLNDYLTLRDLPDVTGLPVNEVLDIDGWDIRKALKLFLKSNSPLYEWLQSPVVYLEDNGFAHELRQLMPAYFSLRAGANHYLSMAYNTFSEDLQGEQVKLKRYFYALRSALACSWIITHKALPPMEFGSLRSLIKDDMLQQEIDKLLRLKKVSDEKELITAIDPVHHWLKETIENCKPLIAELPAVSNTTAELDGIFRKYIVS